MANHGKSIELYLAVRRVVGCLRAHVQRPYRLEGRAGPRPPRAAGLSGGIAGGVAVRLPAPA